MNRRLFITSLALAPLAAVAGRPLGFRRPFESTIGVSAEYSGSMWIYLWDLVDEGYEKVLRNLSEHGLTSISVATAYHAGKFLAPHNPRRKVVFLDDGTVYFKPDPRKYGRIQPRINSLVNAGHGLEKAKKAADKFGFKTRAWIVCCHNTPMGAKYPDIASEGAFGDKLYHNLCPSNGDVRRYIRSLVSDIASHDVDAIELEALQFQGYAHGYHHEREGIELNSAARFLLGLCFCPSCIKRAQSTRLDLVPIRRFTKQALETWFADPAAAAEKYPALDALPADVFDPMLEWRKSVISSLVEEVAEGVRGCELRQMMSVDPLARRLVSVDPATSAKVLGGILALGYVRDGVALREPLKVLQTAIGAAKITLGLQVGLPESGGKKEFLSKMSTAAALGVNSFNFYNYGFIPTQNLTWIKEAFGN
jgi:hypothetical protein